MWLRGWSCSIEWPTRGRPFTERIQPLAPEPPARAHFRLPRPGHACPHWHFDAAGGFPLPPRIKTIGGGSEERRSSNSSAPKSPVPICQRVCRRALPVSRAITTRRNGQRAGSCQRSPKNRSTDSAQHLYESARRRMSGKGNLVSSSAFVADFRRPTMPNEEGKHLCELQR